MTFYYRWSSWFGIRKNIAGLFWDIRYGIGNLIRWFPVIWRDRDWDWVHLSEILEFKLRSQATNELKYGRHKGSGRDARNMLICAELCRRLINEEEFARLERVWDTKHARRYSEKISEHNNKLLGKIIGSHLREWWN